MELSQYILQFINQTNRSLFLTGKAGTGKTTLLQKIVASTHKNTIVAAPTGIAALNAKGVTLHSLFQLPFGIFIPEKQLDTELFPAVKYTTPSSIWKQVQMHKNKKRLIQNIELLIIDEVSMLRADTMDMIDCMLKSVRKNHLPFGGVQLLFIGDLLQLPPVVKNEEWEILKHFYDGIFFFHSNVIRNYPLLYVELEKVYRQSDKEFISILNNLRTNAITNSDVEKLNRYVRKDFQSDNNDGYITLTTHNAKADIINQEALEKLTTPQYRYKAEIVGDFPEYLYPIDEVLCLKKGAQVMFLKNNITAGIRIYNGTIGKVVSLSEEEIIVELEDGQQVEVSKYEWQNIRYQTNSKTHEITEEVLGTFTHYPIRTAWAITIHKSQGLTFDKAVLDIGSVFAPGQAYVALSRLRSLDKLVLLSPISNHGLHTSGDVEVFAQNKASEALLMSTFSSEKKIFLEQYLIRAFSWFDVVVKWQTHVSTYKKETEKSTKSRFRSWAIGQLEKWENILLHSEKFVRQLQVLFSESDFDLHFISIRFEKAKSYFFPMLEDLAYQTMRTTIEVSQLKQVKQFKEELSELNDLQIDVIFNLLKTEALLQSILQGEELSKDTPLLKKAKEYSQDLWHKIYDQLQLSRLQLEQERPKPKDKKSTSQKQPTHEKTWELWLKKMSIEAIAHERKLSEKTIYGHLVTLVSQGKIRIGELLSRNAIAQLSSVFENLDNKVTLTQIKEQISDEFTWEELKLFKAHYFKEN